MTWNSLVSFIRQHFSKTLTGWLDSRKGIKNTYNKKRTHTESYMQIVLASLSGDLIHMQNRECETEYKCEAADPTLQIMILLTNFSGVLIVPILNYLNMYHSLKSLIKIHHLI